MPDTETLRNLVFFDKAGTNYNFSFDPDGCVWTGSVFLKDVSRGLFETECIFLMQKYPGAGQGGADFYGYPSEWDGSPGVYVFEWDNRTDEVDEIQMFGFDDSCPPEDTSSLTYLEYNCPELEYTPSVSVENLVPHGLVPEACECACVNISFCNTDDEYSTFRRDLVMYYVSGEDVFKAGVFRVYAESVEEDERLKVMCRNLGYNITDDDYMWFKATDIKEHREDLGFINAKRKEMLMEGHNIYPFVGSYKSLINIIRFYGYDNLTIKEWWRNVDAGSRDYGKYMIASSYSLENSEVIRHGSNVTLPNRKFRKTSRMSLAWNINRVADADISERGGLPELEETGVYTIEETVIKLYGFKRKLEKEFLPLNAHIVDIVGEASAFGLTRASHNVSDSMTFTVANGCDCDFSIYAVDDLFSAGGEVPRDAADFGYIRDLRPLGVRNDGVHHPLSGNVTLGDIAGETLGSYNVPDPGNVSYDHNADAGDPVRNLEPANGVSVAEPIKMDSPRHTYGKGLSGVCDPDNGVPWNYHRFYLEKNGYTGSWYLADFGRYCGEDGRYDGVLPDCEGIPVGCPVRLRCSGIDPDTPGRVSGHARISWLVYKGGGESDTYLFTITGTFDDGYGDICVALPYVGAYSVEMRIHGYDNSVSVRDKVNCFTVYPKNVEIGGWYKTVPPVLTWESGASWDSLGCDWDWPTAGSGTTWDELGSAAYESLDAATWLSGYYNCADMNARTSVFSRDPDSGSDRAGAYFWDNADVSWEDVRDLNWNNAAVTGNTPCRFAFGMFSQSGVSTNLSGNILEIVDMSGRYGSFLFSGERHIDEWVAGLNASLNPVVSMFEYNKVFVTPDGLPGWEYERVPEGYAIVAVSKYPGKAGDVKYAGFADSAHQASLADGVLTVHKMPGNTVMKTYGGSLSYNPCWLDVKSLSRVQTVGRMTSIVLDYSRCGINGKRNPVWTVRNTVTGKSVTFAMKIFHYVFKEPGCYSVTLSLEDTNGNAYSGTRNVFIVK